jgi:hypothetical protein
MLELRIVTFIFATLTCDPYWSVNPHVFSCIVVEVRIRSREWRHCGSVCWQR